MENEVINVLGSEIVNKLKDKIYNIEDNMNEFLNAPISENNKEKALEKLYLFQLYSNAYIGPDPRVVKNIFLNASLVLLAKNDEELLKRIEELNKTIELMKDIETNPLSTIKRKIEDKKNYGNVIF